MHHRRTFNVDGLALQQLTIGARAVIGHIRRLHRIGEEQQFAGLRADLCMADDMGVGQGLRKVVGGAQGLRLSGLVKRRAHVAVPVPVGLTVGQLHAMYHAVAKEPVQALAGFRICAVAQIATLEFRRYAAGHLEVLRRHLLMHRRKIAGQPERFCVCDCFTHDGPSPQLRTRKPDLLYWGYR